MSIQSKRRSLQRLGSTNAFHSFAVSITTLKLQQHATTNDDANHGANYDTEQCA